MASEAFPRASRTGASRRSWSYRQVRQAGSHRLHPSCSAERRAGCAGGHRVAQLGRGSGQGRIPSRFPVIDEGGTHTVRATPVFSGATPDVPTVLTRHARPWCPSITELGASVIAAHCRCGISRQDHTLPAQACGRAAGKGRVQARADMVCAGQARCPLGSGPVPPGRPIRLSFVGQAERRNRSSASSATVTRPAVGHWVVTSAAHQLWHRSPATDSPRGFPPYSPLPKRSCERPPTAGARRSRQQTAPTVRRWPPPHPSGGKAMPVRVLDLTPWPEPQRDTGPEPVLGSGPRVRR